MSITWLSSKRSTQKRTYIFTLCGISVIILTPSPLHPHIHSIVKLCRKGALQTKRKAFFKKMCFQIFLESQHSWNAGNSNNVNNVSQNTINVLFLCILLLLLLFAYMALFVCLFFVLLVFMLLFSCLLFILLCLFVLVVVLFVLACFCWWGCCSFRCRWL